MTQRPDLFGAALPAVGVMDMLRFHKFTIGWAWKSDYGSPDDAEEFKALMQVLAATTTSKPGTSYPPTLVTTADTTTAWCRRTASSSPRACRRAQAGPAPVLIRIETKAGHGAGKPTSKIIEERADLWAFLVKTLNFKQPKAGTQ